jgi:hypothetical protein
LGGKRKMFFDCLEWLAVRVTSISGVTRRLRLFW